MNISQVAKATQLSAKSIRLYENKGLISKPIRSENGYRQYSNAHIDDLLIIARAKSVGFTLEECKALVHFANDAHTTSAEVKERAEQKLIEVKAKLAELTVIKNQLEKWVSECPGDSGRHCPIMEDLKS
jgi:MerR family copper efflux transcriptional regulator